MPNTTRLYTYEVRASNGVTRYVLSVRADTSIQTLTLGGIVNLEAIVAPANATLRLIIQGRGGPKTKGSYARSVTVEMTAAANPLSVGSRAVVVVPRMDRWTSYQVGQTGTYLGGACICVDKVDGRPSLNGRQF